MTSSIVTLSIECYCAECRDYLNTMLSFIMLNVIMLCFIMLNAIILSVIMTNVVMMSVVMFNVVMLSVVAPTRKNYLGTMFNSTVLVSLNHGQTSAYRTKAGLSLQL
jgi:hypothetical protein